MKNSIKAAEEKEGFRQHGWIMAWKTLSVQDSTRLLNEKQPPSHGANGGLGQLAAKPKCQTFLIHGWSSEHPLTLDILIEH